MSRVSFLECSDSNIAEEVRVQLIELLDLALETESAQFLPQLAGLCSMLAKALLDQNPDMKNQAARFCSKLATTLGKKVGTYFKPLTESLVANLQHQHSKVRKETLRGLRDVLSCKGAEPFMEGSALA